MSARTLSAVAAMVAVAAQVVVPPLAAQETDSTATATVSKRPQLGPHRFVPNPLVRDPFPRTFTRLAAGVGRVNNLPITTELEIPGDTIEPVTAAINYNVLGFQYMQRIKSWMSFWLRFDSRTRLGDDAGALLAEGVTLSRSYELGWMFRLVESRRIAFSASAQVLNKKVTAIQLLQYIEGVLDSTEVPLIDRVPLTRVGGSLRFAWAANAWLGFNATGDIEYGQTVDRTEPNSASGSAGVSADIDFAPLINAPIGLVLAGQAVFAADRTIRNIEDLRALLVRVAYVGREDFLIALDGVLTRSPLETIDVTTTTLAISMRYYF